MQYEFDMIYRDMNAALSKEGNICGNKNRIARCIELCVSAIKSMNLLIHESPFENVNEEVQFYKRVRPQFLSKFYYYRACYKVEQQIPGGSIKKKEVSQRMSSKHRCLLFSPPYSMDILSIQ